MLRNKRIAHTIHDHLVAGLLLVCMAGIGESAYAQVAATGGIVSIEPVSTSRTINEAGGTYEFDVVFEFLPTNATFFRGRRRVNLGFQGGRIVAGGGQAPDPRVTPTQDYSVSVDGVEQTLTATRPTRLGTIYELPFGSIEFGSGSVTGDPLPADRRLTRRIVLTAKDDGVDEGPNTTPGGGTEFILLIFNPSNPDGGTPSPPVPSITYTSGRIQIAILDNDSNPPGVTVTPTSLATTEGGMATFTVVLDSEPAGYEVRNGPPLIQNPGTPTVPVYELTNEVRVTVTSTDPIDGGLVSSVGTTPAISTVLTFTDDGGATPWDTPQSVTVNGADNFVSGSDVTYDITFNADGGTFTPGSEGRVDHDYDGVTVAAVSVTNTDNDGMHGVIVTETGDSTIVAEDGGTDTFTVALRSEPADDVILTLTSSDTNEGTVDMPTLTFTPTSGTEPWNTPQTVTVTGVNDNIDSDDSFTVDFQITDGDGANYPLTPSIPAVTVTATNDDNASTNITLAIISPTNVAETADNTQITITATLGGTVVLGTPINITVTPTGENSFTLTIPALSLSATRTFGIDPDADADTNDETITISGTASGFTVTPTTLTIKDAGLSVFQDMSGGIPITVAVTGATEGAAHTFYVALTRAPMGNVVVAPTSRDPTGLTVNTPSLTFTTANWNMRQAVSVTGVDDDVFRTDSETATATDRDHRVDFAVTSGDGDVYPDTLLLASTNVRVTENDRVPLVLSASPTDIPESAGATTVTVTAMIMGSTRVARQITQIVRLVDSSGTTPGQASFRSGFFQDGEVVSHPGPITIPPFGDSGTTTFTIDPYADSDVEGREIFSINPTGTGHGVLSVSVVEIGIVESGVLAFEAQTGGDSIDAVMIAEGSNGTLHVQLASIPATGSSVTIGVTSSDTNEGTVNMAALTFTDTTWETRQAVTVTAVNDDIDRDDTFTVDFEITTTTDTTNYPTTLSIPSVTVTATDDDTAGIALFEESTSGAGSTAVTAITTTEAGGTDTFYVQLTSQPTGTVTVTIDGIIATEHTLTTPASGTLTFTPTGATAWNTRQEIMLTRVDDDFVDGDQMYNLTLTPTGGGYDSVTPAIVSITNTDDDTAGLTIADLMVDEDVGTATVTVTLTPAVTAGTVTVDVTTMDGTATTAGGDYTAITSQTLTFVAGNTSQTLDITINDDIIDETDETITVMLDNLMLPTGVTTVSIADATATVTITDNDAVSDTINLSVNPPTIPETAGATTITVTATLGGSGVASPTETVVTVSVGGGTATSGTDYTAVPDFTLTIPALSSSGMATFMIDPNTSSDNGDTVMITGTATINGMTAMVNSATLTIVEAGISVYDAMSAGTEISTATIAEASGSDILYVQLASQPATGSSVVIGVTSSDTNEGTVNMATLTFTDTNWNARQPVTVTAVNDNVDRDGDSFMVDFAVTTGDGGNYTTSLDLSSVTVTITDDDTAGLALFDATTGNTTVTTITTGEPDTTTTFYVALESEPTANVTVAVASDTTEEGQVTSGASLTFTSTNWNMRQAVTVTGQDDNDVDGDQTYTVTLNPASSDTAYNALTDTTVTATNTDDDTAELTIADTSVDEDAGTATVTVTLSAMVTAGAVTVDATTMGGTATAGTDYTTITSETLTFTAGSTSETLDITISDDSIAENDETFTVMLDSLSVPPAVSGDASITDATATVTITDDETAPTTITLGISQPTVPETAGATEITITATIDGTAVLPIETVVTVSVGGGTATSGTDYTAVPNFDLTIPPLSLSATGTFMIDPTDDSTSDNNETVMISGTAPGFTTVNAATLTILEAGISVFDVATGGTSTDTITIADENSGTMTFYVQLISAPASDVTLTLTSSDTNEGTVMPGTLTFTATPGATSWDSRQAVTVTAVDDNVDRDDSFMVDFAVTTGDSGNYPTTLNLSSVTVTVTDDDTVGIALFDAATGTDAPSITTTEGATTDSFYVVLESEPTGTVTVTISGLVATEHTLDPVAGTLTFTPTGATAWNTRQEITLTGVDDNVVDGDQTYDITLTPTGGGYDSVTAPTVSITNTDDDTAAISIADLTIDENAGTATLTVTLTPAVTAGNVTVDLTTMDGTATAGEDYTAFISETLTIAEGSTTQTLDIPINNDNIDETDETFTVTLDNLMLPAAVTGDVTITDATATITITDDDTLSDTINLSVSPLTVAEIADATTITVTATIDGTAVSLMPTTVTVSVGGGTATSGTDYAAVTDFTLTIPAESASGMATFMIDPTDDTTDDNNETVMITGTAPGFTTVTPATLNIVEAGISVHDAMTAGNPITTATIAEASGTDMLYVQLASQPATSSSVVIGVTSSDMNEGTVNMAALTFTDATWNIRQPVTVTAVPDNIDDDDTFTVDFAITSGDSANYTTSLTLPSVTVTVTDDDTVSNTINLSISPPSIAEIADATTITVTATIGGTVVLPTSTIVTVSVGGGTATSGTDYAAVTDFTLTIPAESASGMATFMIDPTDDTTDDNNETVMITGTAPGFTTINPATLTIVEAGISVHDAMTAGNPITTATIAEASGTDMLYVQLASQPATSSSVVIGVTSSDMNEGTVNMAALTFTDATWNIRQPVTVTAVPDNIDDDDTFTVDFAITSGDSANYTTSLTLPSVTVTVTDDDTVSNTINLSISPPSIAETAASTEITVTATIGGTVVLPMPTTVTVSVGGGTATSGTDYAAVTGFTLTIPAESASGMATFMIDPTDDTTDDNNETVMITGTAPGFTTINPATLTIVEAGISVHDAMTAGNPITTATIAEASGTDMLYVQLASQPATSSSVVIGVTSSDMNEGTVNMAALTFTDATWNIRQPVTVTAVPDNIDDDDTFTVDFAITSGDSANYTTSLTLPSVTVTVTDDDTVSNTINLSISPPSVAEIADATTITVTATIDGTVVLPMPTTVTVSVGGGTATSGTDYAAVTDFTLTIPAESASGMATFMIDPTDDTTDDNNETVMITGTAPGFTTVTPATLNIVEAGISVHDAMTAGNPITTATIAEASGTDMLYVQLASQPATSSSVVIGVTSSDMNEGTVNMAALTFTDATWNIRQPVTVTAVPDNIDDDDTFTVDFAITSGDSANYTTSLTLPSVTVTVTDDDTVSNTINLSISPPSIAETAASTEITVTATIGGTVVLPMPTTVTVSVGGGTATSGTDYAAVTGFTLTIPAESASGMATFMIDPTDDTTDDNNETVMITGTAPGFTTINPATLTIVEAGISVHDAMTAGNPITTATIAEASGTGMLYVQLASQPATSSSVVIGVTSSDMNEGTVNMAALTFTDATWNIRQPVTVTAVPDNIDDDDTFTVDFAITSGDSANYTTSLTLPSVTVTVTDDDTVSNTINLSISPPSIAETAASTEITVTATIGGTVVLPMPTTVTVSVGGGTATSGTDYAAVTGFTLTIPAESASGMATFMIDPTDDTTDDNNETVMITGTAPGFTTVTPATLNIVEAGISVHDAMTAGNPITTATIAEASGTDMLYVQLASQPAGNVTLSVTSDDTNEGTVSTPTLTFSDTNWDTRQLITVTAVDDNIDRDDTFMVGFAIMSGDSVNYTSSLTLPSVTVTITDDDTVSDTITLSVSPLSVAETADATDITVTATLGSAVVLTTATDVMVTISDGTATGGGIDYTATPATLTITIPAEATSGNGVFSMTPVADDESDTDETITISGTSGSLTVTPATLTIIEGLNTEQREVLHTELLGVANQATMQVMVDVLSKRLKPRARTEAHGSVAGHVLGLQEGQAVDWQKRLSLAVYSTLQRLDEGGALLVPVDATTFNNSEFALPLEVGESVVVLWGALGSSTVTGGQSDAHDYDGDLIAVLLGIDSMIGEHARLGIAASYEHSELDYQLDMTSGDAVQTMTGIQPYLSWQPHDSVALWLMGGYGFGDYDATESTAGGTTLRAEDADVERWMAALGFHYVHRFGSSGWDMVLNNKALWNRTVRDEARFDDGSLLPKNVSANWRARLESEVGYSWTFGDGSLRPYGLASVRWDGGDVVNDDTTFMVDAGGGVELSFASRLSMDFKVRRQVTDGDHEEHNVIAVGSFGFAEHEDGQGWQVALERSLLGGLRAPERNKAGFDFEQGDSTPTIGQSPSLQANVGYGRLINPLTDAKAGLLKTYTRFYLDPDENKRHALGLGFDFASLQVGVESEYNNGELETLLRGHIDF